MPRMRVTTAATSMILVILILVAALSSPPPVAAHEDDEEGGGPPVFLVHGVPDAVFEVQVGDDRRLKGLRFGQFYNLRAFAGTTLSLGFTILDTGEPVVATDGFDVPLDRSSSLVVHLADDVSGELTAFENELDQLSPGMSRLIVRHLAAAPPVDVMVDGDKVLTDVAHGWEDSVELPQGDVAVSLMPSGEAGGSPIAPIDVSLTPGDRTIVYVFGSADDGTVSVVTDIVHGPVAEPGEGLPLPAMTLSTAAAAAIGAFGLYRIRRRVTEARSGASVQSV